MRQSNGFNRTSASSPFGQSSQIISQNQFPVIPPQPGYSRHISTHTIHPLANNYTGEVQGSRQGFNNTYNVTQQPVPPPMSQYQPAYGNSHLVPTHGYVIPQSQQNSYLGTGKAPLSVPVAVQPGYRQISVEDGGFIHPNLFEAPAQQRQIQTTTLIRNLGPKREFQSEDMQLQTEKLRVYKKQNIERVFGRDVEFECDYEPVKLFSTKELRNFIANGFEDFQRNLKKLESNFCGLESSFFHLLHKAETPKELFDRLLVTLDRRVEKFFETFEEAVIQNRGLAAEYFDTAVLRNDYEFWNFRAVLKQGIVEVSNKLNDLFLSRDNQSFYDAQVIRQVETITRLYQFLKSDLNTILHKSNLKYGKILEACTYNYENGKGLQTVNFADFLQLDIASLVSAFSDEFQRSYPVLLNKKQIVVKKFHEILKDKAAQNQFDLKQLVRSIFSRERRKVYRTIYNVIAKNGKQELCLTESLEAQNKTLTERMNRIKDSYLSLKGDSLYLDVMSGRINLEGIKSQETEFDDSNTLLLLEVFMVNTQQLIDDMKYTLTDIILYKQSESDHFKEIFADIMSRAVSDLNQAERLVQEKGDMSEYLLYQFQILDNALDSDPDRESVEDNLDSKLFQQLKKNKANYHLHNIAADLAREVKDKGQKRQALEENQIKKTKEFSSQIESFLTKPMIDKARGQHPSKDYVNQKEYDDEERPSIKGLADKLLDTIKLKRNEDLEKERQLRYEQDQIRTLKESQLREEKERLQQERQSKMDLTSKKFKEKKDQEEQELQQRIAQRKLDDEERKQRDQDRLREDSLRKQRQEEDRKRTREEQDNAKRMREEDEIRKRKEKEDEDLRKQRERDEFEKNKKQREEEDKKRKNQVEEDRRRQREVDDQRRRDEEENQKRNKSQNDLLQKKREEEDRIARQKADEEKKRVKEEEEQKRKLKKEQDDRERKRRDEEEDLNRKQAEEDRKRLREEEDEKRRKEDDDRKKRAIEDDNRKKREKEEEDRRRKEREEEDRKKREKEEEDRKKREKDEVDRKKREKDEDDRKKREKEEEDRKKREKDEVDRKKREKDEDDRKKRERDEEDRKKREKEETDRKKRDKDEEDRKKREKDEEDRKKREKDEEDRKKREKDEEDRKKREREEEDRKKKEKEEAELKQRQKDEENRKKREKEEEDRKKREKEEENRKKREEEQRLAEESKKKNIKKKDSGINYDDFDDFDYSSTKKKSDQGKGTFDDNELYNEDILEDSDNFQVGIGKFNVKSDLPKIDSKKVQDEMLDFGNSEDNLLEVEEASQKKKPNASSVSLGSKKNQESKKSLNYNEYDEDFEIEEEDDNKLFSPKNVKDSQKKSDNKSDNDDYEYKFEDIEEDMDDLITKPLENKPFPKATTLPLPKVSALPSLKQIGEKEKKRSEFDYEYDLDEDEEEEEAPQKEQKQIEKDNKLVSGKPLQEEEAKTLDDDIDYNYEIPEDMEGDVNGDFEEGIDAAGGEQPQEYTKEQMEQIMLAQQQQEQENYQITYDLIAQTNEYVRKTRFGRANHLNLANFNSFDYIVRIYEEFIQNQQVFLFDITDGDKLIQLFEAYQSQQEDFERLADDFAADLQKTYYENTQLTDFNPESKLYFALQPNQLIEVNLAQQAVSYFYMVDENEEGVVEQLNEFHAFFTFTLRIDNFQAVPTIVEDNTLKVLQQFEKEPHLQYMIMIFPLVYEFMSDVSDISVDQNTLERIFYIQLSLENFYAELDNQQEAVTKKFGTLLEQYQGNPSFLISSQIYEEFSQESLGLLLQDMNEVKQEVLESVEKKYGLTYFEIVMGETHFSFYFYVLKSTDKQVPHEIGLFCLSLSSPVNSQLIEAFEELQEETCLFRPHVDNSRHNGLYEYSEFTLAIWAHLIEKKKLSPFIAINIINFSMIPYYITYKGLD